MKQTIKSRTHAVTADVKSFAILHSTVIIATLVFVLVIRVFVPQLSSLKESLEAVKDANKVLLTEAMLVFVVGFPILAIKYKLIAQFKLKYWLTLQVQIASAFISKLLPMSIGSLTVNTYYLTSVSKSVASAASTMTLNALTSSFAFLLIIIFALISSQTDITSGAAQQDITWWHILALVVLVAFAVWLVLKIKKVRAALNKGIQSIWNNFKLYKKQPAKASYGVIFNMCGSLTGITALYLCTHAVGLGVTYPQAILSYTLGNIIGSLVPTPGGLGGAEAGLYAGLAFFGYDTSLCLTAVLLYRLISYWIPIIPGYLMYRHLRHTTLSDFHIHKKAQA